MARINELQGYFDNYTLKEHDAATAKKNGILMTVEGVFQVEDEKNRNGRIYPSDTWDTVFTNQEFNERLKSRNMYGELDHPSDGGSLQRASHVVTHLERKVMENRKVIWGKADVLDTPSGQILASLFRARTKPGISSRGDGSTENKEGTEFVAKDYLPEGWDFVIKPSTLGAYPVLTESEKKNHDGVLTALGKLVEKTDDTKVLLNTYLLLEGYGKGAQPLITKLEEKLRVNDNRATRSTKIEHCKEESMDLEKLDKGVQSDILQMARDLAAVQIKESEDKVTKREMALKEQIAGISARLERKTREVEAAEKIIDAFSVKCEALKARPAVVDTKQVTEYKKALYNTGKRLEAAKKLLGALMEKTRTLKPYVKRYQAAEKLVQAFIDKTDKSKVESYVRETLRGVKDPTQRKRVESLVAGAKSVKEAEEKLSTLADIMTRKPAQKPVQENKDPAKDKDADKNRKPMFRRPVKETQEPLPGDKTKPITEDVLPKPQITEVVSFMDKLEAKVAGTK